MSDRKNNGEKIIKKKNFQREKRNKSEHNNNRSETGLKAVLEFGQTTDKFKCFVKIMFFYICERIQFWFC